jgi:hypothetical protein
MIKKLRNQPYAPKVGAKRGKKMIGLEDVGGDRLMLQQASVIWRYFQSEKIKRNVEIMSVCV